MFPFRNNLVLRLEGQPGPQREKKRAFNMGDRTADISTPSRTSREREKGELLNG